MQYHVYKLSFPGGVHFGQRTLESAAMTFQADRLFSAVCMEALAMGEDALKKLVSLVKGDRILLSDALPYAGDEYFLPKPMLHIDSSITTGDPKQRKKFKKLEYLPVRLFSRYLLGKCTIDELESDSFGSYTMRTSVHLRPGEDAEPYRVGTFFFKERCGLYILVGYEKEEDLDFFDELLEMLSLSGIGGERSSGLGRFDLRHGSVPEELSTRLQDEYGMYMSLGVSLPQPEELEGALEDARYLLVKRSGFVASEAYAPEPRRKRDTYAFSIGSCFRRKFRGQLRDVSNRGKHPVYCYLKPMFMGIGK